MDISEVPVGTEVYFKKDTGSVLKGTLLEGPPYEHGYAYTDAQEGARVAKVNIDWEPTPTDDDWPNHMAPESYQPNTDTGAVFRDAYTIDAETQTYIVRDDNFEGLA